MNLIQAENKSGILTFTATNGFTLVNAVYDTTSEDCAALFDPKTIREIIAAKYPAGIDVSLDKSGLTVDGKFYAKSTEEGIFPDWRQVMPDYSKYAKITAFLPKQSDFTPAVAAIAKMSKSFKAEISKLYFRQDSMSFIVTSEEYGSSRREISGITANLPRDFMIALNAHYLNSIVKYADGMDIAIAAIAGNSPLKIEYANITAIIMPCWLDNKQEQSAPEIVIPDAAPSFIYKGMKTGWEDVNASEAHNCYPYPVADLPASMPAKSGAAEFIVTDIIASEGIYTFSETEKSPCGHIDFICEAAPAVEAQIIESPIAAAPIIETEVSAAPVVEVAQAPEVIEVSPVTKTDKTASDESDYETQRAAILKKYAWIEKTDPRYKSTIHNGRINLRDELAALDAQKPLDVTAEFAKIKETVSCPSTSA